MRLQQQNLIEVMNHMLLFFTTIQYETHKIACIFFLLYMHAHEDIAHSI